VKGRGVIEYGFSASSNTNDVRVAVAGINRKNGSVKKY
jgi:hypothetical protein